MKVVLFNNERISFNIIYDFYNYNNFNNIKIYENKSIKNT